MAALAWGEAITIRKYALFVAEMNLKIAVKLLSYCTSIIFVNPVHVLQVCTYARIELGLMQICVALCTLLVKGRREFCRQKNP